MRFGTHPGVILTAIVALCACGDDDPMADSGTTVTVTATAGAGGQVSPDSTTVPAGKTTAITVTADSGYEIDTVTGCDGSLSGSVYTTGRLTDDCVVSASFSPVDTANKLTVSGVAGTGGSISPATQSVAEGETATLTVTPDEGYSIDRISGCDGSLSGSTYTTGEISADCVVSVSFLLVSTTDNVTVSGVAGTGGSISPSTQSVARGETATLTVTPDEGYNIDGVSGCDGSLSGSDYTTGNLTEDCVVSVSFSHVTTTNSVTVTGIAGAGGSITPASQSVTKGEAGSLTVTPDSGYDIDSISGCGGSRSGSTYTTAAVTADCAVTVSFSRRFTVTSSAGPGGSISPATQSGMQGSTATLTVTPDDGYHIDVVNGCGGSLAGTTYTTASLFVDCAVAVSFKAEHTVTGLAGSGGSISPSTQAVVDGESAMLTITPDSGYYVKSISGCGSSYVGSNNVATGNISADCTVDVAFAARGRVYAGGSESCVLLDDGNAKCWGQNSSGQLGVPSFSLTAHGDEAGESPVTNTTVELADEELAINSMSIGSQHACAILSDNNLYCWGEGQNGQTGLGINADRKMMTRVPLDDEPVAEVSAGGQFSCARLLNGEVYCWGLNSSGELGIGSNDTHYAPSIATTLPDTPLQLATGAAHACARLANNSIYCWGDNSSGQLGNNNGGVDSNVPSPLALPTGTVTDLDAGGLFACAIIDTNVYCWGENGSGQLGNNDGTNTDLDVLSAALDLSGEVPRKLALGGEHGCVLTMTGKVFCWGESDAGQTGQNDTTDDLAPLQVDLGPYTATDIAAGNDQTCVSLLPDDSLDTERPIRCWGEGGVGQLGLESTSDIGDDEPVANVAYNLNF